MRGLTVGEAARTVGGGSNAVWFACDSIAGILRSGTPSIELFGYKHGVLALGSAGSYTRKDSILFWVTPDAAVAGSHLSETQK